MEDVISKESLSQLYWNQAYDLCLSRKAEVQRFLIEIGSSIPRKKFFRV